MEYRINKNNYPSYHYIEEARNGGKESIDNGAILSHESHLLLHFLEAHNYELYLQWQLLFIDINDSKKPIDLQKHTKIL